MSDWGHAMFADENDRVNGALYGGRAWEFDANNTNGNVVDINELKSKTKMKWEKVVLDFENNGYYTGYNGEDLTYFLEQVKEQNLTFDDVFSYLNPSNIVTSAEGYDGDLGIWFYANVLENSNIDAIITSDGAIVYNQSLIKRRPDLDFYGT